VSADLLKHPQKLMETLAETVLLTKQLRLAAAAVAATGEAA